MTARTTRSLQIGLVLDGPGADPVVRRREAAVWRRPERWADTVAAAEWGGVDFVVLADRLTVDGGGAEVARPDPIELAAHLTAITERIGLVVRTAVTHAEPFHLSNRLSSLDRAGGGRLGWWAGPDHSRSRARAYGRTESPDPGTARREAAEILEAVRALWDSWEDDALVADGPGGRFLDRGRIHYVDHAGEFFAVRGPALLPRPIQGAPPILVDGGPSGVGVAEVAVVSGVDEIGVVTAAATARNDGAARVFAQIEIDFSEHPTGAAGTTGAVLQHHSSPEELERVLRRLSDHVDGVVLVPADTGRDLGVLTAQVLPPLFESAVTQRPASATTLRDRWGLPRPENRFDVARRLVRS